MTHINNIINHWQQRDSMGCGAATAMMILNFFGLLDNYSVEIENEIYSTLRGVNGIGTNPSALCELLRENGLKAEIHQSLNKKQRRTVILLWVVGAIFSLFNKAYKQSILLAKDLLGIMKAAIGGIKNSPNPVIERTNFTWEELTEKAIAEYPDEDLYDIREEYKNDPKLAFIENLHKHLNNGEIIAAMLEIMVPGMATPCYHWVLISGYANNGSYINWFDVSDPASNNTTIPASTLAQWMNTSFGTIYVTVKAK